MIFCLVHPLYISAAHFLTYRMHCILCCTQFRSCICITIDALSMFHFFSLLQLSQPQHSAGHVKRNPGIIAKPLKCPKET